jgi:hypothetical protein
VELLSCVQFQASVQKDQVCGLRLGVTLKQSGNSQTGKRFGLFPALYATCFVAARNWALCRSNSIRQEASFMKRIFSLFALSALSACVAAAQASASGQAGTSMNPQTSAQASTSNGTSAGSSSGKASTSSPAPAKKAANSVTIADGTKIDVQLVSCLDARRSRVGDPVEAQIEQDVKQGGKVVLKKGTQLGGRVTVSQARVGSRGQSQIGIAFERALLPNGVSIPLHASILALSAPPSIAAGADSETVPSGAMASTPASARASAAPAAATAMNTSNATTSVAAGTTNAAAHSSGGSASSVRLTSNSKGVFGLEGLSLGSAKPAQGSVIASSTKNVRLNSGTEMLLRTSSQAR